jgi:hypothetical protein
VSYADESEQQTPKLSITLNKLLLLVGMLVIVYFAYERYALYKSEQVETSVLILTPQFNDVYFLDLKLKNDKVEAKNKYQLAKVIRVSDDNVAVVYGNYFYQWQYSVVNSIRYGDLTNNDYFTLIPDYISLSKIKEMRSDGSIYLVKRPIRNKLYGGLVSL